MPVTFSVCGNSLSNSASDTSRLSTAYECGIETFKVCNRQSRRLLKFPCFFPGKTALCIRVVVFAQENKKIKTRYEYENGIDISIPGCYYFRETICIRVETNE